MAGEAKSYLGSFLWKLSEAKNGELKHWQIAREILGGLLIVPSELDGQELGIECCILSIPEWNMVFKPRYAKYEQWEKYSKQFTLDGSTIKKKILGHEQCKLALTSFFENKIASNLFSEEDKVSKFLFDYICKVTSSWHSICCSLEPKEHKFSYDALQNVIPKGNFVIVELRGNLRNELAFSLDKSVDGDNHNFPINTVNVYIPINIDRSIGKSPEGYSMFTSPYMITPYSDLSEPRIEIVTSSESCALKLFDYWLTNNGCKINPTIAGAKKCLDFWKLMCASANLVDPDSNSKARYIADLLENRISKLGEAIDPLHRPSNLPKTTPRKAHYHGGAGAVDSDE